MIRRRVSKWLDDQGLTLSSGDVCWVEQIWEKVEPFLSNLPPNTVTRLLELELFYLGLSWIRGDQCLGFDFFGAYDGRLVFGLEDREIKVPDRRIAQVYVRDCPYAYLLVPQPVLSRDDFLWFVKGATAGRSGLLTHRFDSPLYLVSALLQQRPTREMLQLLIDQLAPFNDSWAYYRSRLLFGHYVPQNKRASVSHSVLISRCLAPSTRRALVLGGRWGAFPVGPILAVVNSRDLVDKIRRTQNFSKQYDSIALEYIRPVLVDDVRDLEILLPTITDTSWARLIAQIISICKQANTIAGPVTSMRRLPALQVLTSP